MKKYFYKNFEIEIDSLGPNLTVRDISKLNIEQKILFQQMISSSILDFEKGTFVLSDKDILTYWSYCQENYTDYYSCEKYFEILNLEKIYTTKVPFLKPEGVFADEKYKLKIIFCDKLTKMGPLNPKAYQRDGFGLLDFEGKLLGSLFPEYVELFCMVDEANKNWAFYTQAERYSFIDNVKKLAQKRIILLPDFFSTTEIEHPQKVKINIVKKNETSYEMIVDMDNEKKNEQINKSLCERTEADQIYTVRDKDKQTKIIFSDKQKRIIQDVKKSKNYNTEKLKDFISSLPEYWTDEIVDASELFGDRVIGYGLLPRYDNFDIKESVIDWFNDADNFLTNDFGENLGEPEQTTPKFGLIIKENEFDVNYEEQIQTLEKNNKEFIFPKILSLKDNIELKSYQREGIAWLYTNFQKKIPGVIFADDMGLGKTLQTLAFIHAVDEMHIECRKKLTVLIVVPIILLDSWIDENKKFFNSDLCFKIGNNNKSELSKILAVQQEGKRTREVILISYEFLRANQQILAKINWDIIILDEAQKIKSSLTLVSKTAKALKGKFKVALTGTPVENSFLDIWSIADFAIPGFLGSKIDFMSEFDIKNTDTDDEIIGKGNNLRNKLGILFLRRTKGDVLSNLPQKNIENRSYLMPKKQLNTYEEALTLLFGTSGNSFNKKLTVLHELKKISDHPILFSKSKLEKALIEDSAKLLLVDILLKEIKKRNEKVIIFAEFYRSQELLAELIFEKFGFVPDIINGKTTNSGYYSRKKLIDRFSQKDGFNVIIMSPLAAGVGLTITAANNVVNFSRHWNPAKEEQAIDRVYRIGQKKNVFVYNLLCTTKEFKTFDENLDKLLSIKKNIKSAVLYPSESPQIKQDMMTYFFNDDNT